MALARKLPLISDRPLARAGLNSEAVLRPGEEPSVFEREVAKIEDDGLRSVIERAAQANLAWQEFVGDAATRPRNTKTRRDKP